MPPGRKASVEHSPPCRTTRRLFGRVSEGPQEPVHLPFGSSEDRALISGGAALSGAGRVGHPPVGGADPPQETMDAMRRERAGAGTDVSASQPLVAPLLSPPTSPPTSPPVPNPRRNSGLSRPTPQSPNAAQVVPIR